MTEIASSEAVLDFWFEELGSDAWFAKSDDVDALIRTRFSPTHRAACACELSAWRVDAAGRLAEIIVLDQFSRNMYRDDARAFAADGVALALSQEAISGGFDLDLPIQHRAFLYMPFMHLHAETLFSAPGLEFNLEFERKHKAIIDRFGRYPHRNAVLGRVSTGAEIAFLAEPGSAF
jgi:uncharacterized protein (DUF924 family)